MCAMCGNRGRPILCWESVTGQRSNRLVCRPSLGPGQRVVRNLWLTHPILVGPYQGDTFRSHRAARIQVLTSTLSVCALPHRPRFARYQPADWTENVDSPVDGNWANSRSPKFRVDLHAVDD